MKKLKHCVAPKFVFPQNIVALAVCLCLNFTAEGNIMKSFLFVWIVFSIAISFELLNNCLKSLHRITTNESNPPTCIIMNRDQTRLWSHYCKSQAWSDSAKRINTNTMPCLHLYCTVVWIKVITNGHIEDLENIPSSSKHVYIILFQKRFEGNIMLTTFFFHSLKYNVLILHSCCREAVGGWLGVQSTRPWLLTWLTRFPL